MECQEDEKEIKMFFPIETEVFTYQHILDSDSNLLEIDKFQVKPFSGQGLEHYLKQSAIPILL